MKYIVVIPARGGSKRLPRKNLLLLAGKPLIAHSIAYAKQGLPGCEVIVSSDSEEILAIGQENGALGFKRPEELSGDFVTTAAVLQHVGNTALEQGIDFDFMVLLQATNPLRPKNMLRQAIEIIEKDGYDSLMTVSRSTKKLGKIIDNRFVPWNYKFGMRSQDLEPLYYENGLLYITAKDQILQGKIMGERMFPMVIDHIFGDVDIDTKDDFLYAEFLIQSVKDDE